MVYKETPKSYKIENFKQGNNLLIYYFFRKNNVFRKIGGRFDRRLLQHVN